MSDGFIRCAECRQPGRRGLCDSCLRAARSGGALSHREAVLSRVPVEERRVLGMPPEERARHKDERRERVLEVARIAATILPFATPIRLESGRPVPNVPEAVKLARALIAEAERTEP